VGNLFHAIKLIAAKVLPAMPISGNILAKDGRVKTSGCNKIFAPQNKMPTSPRDAESTKGKAEIYGSVRSGKNFEKNSNMETKTYKAMGHRELSM
jgi:hypothetical protein